MWELKEKGERKGKMFLKLSGHGRNQEDKDECRTRVSLEDRRRRFHSAERRTRLDGEEQSSPERDNWCPELEERRGLDDGWSGGQDKSTRRNQIKLYSLIHSWLHEYPNPRPHGRTDPMVNPLVPQEAYSLNPSPGF